MQQEAGLERQVYCRIQVVVSGERSNAVTLDLSPGCNIRVSGFVAYQTGRNGLGKLVLHADEINQI